MDNEYWAVFNGHVNNASERAMVVTRLRFPATDIGMVALEAAYRDGIMAIFNDDPTPASRLFSAACYIFANDFDKVDWPVKD